MSDPLVIADTNADVIAQALLDHGVERAHFVNGIFGAPQQLVLPMQAAWFKGLDCLSKLSGVFNTFAPKDHLSLPYTSLVKKNDAFIIAVNSNVSVDEINEEKIARGEDTPPYVNQYERAANMAVPLAKMFPNRPVIVIFYDEKEPAKSQTQECEGLYDRLNKAMPNLLQTLMKGDYGTSKEKGEIVGASLFRKVFGIPLPKDTAHISPECATLNKPSQDDDNIKVMRLTDHENIFGRPMMTDKNKVLFSMPKGFSDLQESVWKRIPAVVSSVASFFPAMK